MCTSFAAAATAVILISLMAYSAYWRVRRAKGRREVINSKTVMLRLLLLIGMVAVSSTLLRSQETPTSASRKPGYPVQYSSRLNLSSASEIDKRLDAPFAEGTAPTGVNNCTQLLAKCGVASKWNCASQFPSTSDRDLDALKWTFADCLVLRELQLATPATSSHVAELKWDEHVLLLLPPQLAINVSDELIRKAKEAAARGESWSNFDKSATAGRDGPDQIVVQGDGFVERVILWGRGNFDGDGVEELLVQTLDTLTGGTYRNTRLFILTRKSPHGKLSVVRAPLL